MNTSIGIAVFIKEYLRWHYNEGVKEIWEMWHNLLWFGYHYFSIPLLARTLFRPIYRIHEGYNRLQTMEEFFQNIAVNMIARVVGVFMRLFIMIIGIIFEAIILALGPILFAIWIGFPFVLGVLFLTSFYLIVA